MKRLFFFSLPVILLLLVAAPWYIRKPSSLGDALRLIFRAGSFREENLVLRKELFDTQSLLSKQPPVISTQTDFISAKVFSSYPFNPKQRIFLAAGKNQGLNEGNPVLFSKTVLVGFISRVFDDTSEVLTVFDSKFSLPVRLGDNEVDGLLEGGIVPRVTLIDKGKSAVAGGRVINAAKEAPYGLLLGNLETLREDVSGAFLESPVSLPYVLGDLKELRVLFR